MNELNNLKKIQSVISIKKSKIRNAGNGAFATKDLPKNYYLGWYRGKKLTEEQYQKQENDDYIWEVNDKNKIFYIDARPIKNNNKLRYVNGAKTKLQKKKVNVESYQYNKQIRYRTTKKVKSGDELLIDYGDEYF